MPGSFGLEYNDAFISGVKLSLADLRASFAYTERPENTENIKQNNIENALIITYLLKFEPIISEIKGK